MNHTVCYMYALQTQISERDPRSYEATKALSFLLDFIFPGFTTSFFVFFAEEVQGDAIFWMFSGFLRVF